MAFTENLDLFVADFGVNGTLAGAPVRGIFDAAYDVSTLGAIGMGSASPAYTLPSAKVPAQAHGAALTVPAGSYLVRQAQHDGTGMCVLILERSA